MRNSTVLASGPNRLPQGWSWSFAGHADARQDETGENRAVMSPAPGPDVEALLRATGAPFLPYRSFHNPPVRLGTPADEPLPPKAEAASPAAAAAAAATLPPAAAATAQTAAEAEDLLPPAVIARLTVAAEMIRLPLVEAALAPAAAAPPAAAGAAPTLARLRAAAGSG